MEETIQRFKGSSARSTPRAGERSLRLAIISTPRSGNTWVRKVLASTLDLEERSCHFPEQIDWDRLPRRCILQIHWMPDEPFPEMLELHGFQVLVLARHPLDVLISWLNHIYNVHVEGICRGGSICNECGIVGVAPRSEEYLWWIEGRWGDMTLGYSPAWWNRPDVLRARYEDLVATPELEFERLIDALGALPRYPVKASVLAASVEQMKFDRNVWHFHYWQGQPGLWKSLFTKAEARRIAAAHASKFEILGYACDPDITLLPEQADANWIRLQLDSTRDYLRIERSNHQETKKQLQSLQAVGIHALA